MVQVTLTHDFELGQYDKAISDLTDRFVEVNAGERAEPGATIALGFNRELTRDQLRQAAATGEIEGLVRWVPVAAGDTVVVPPGKVGLATVCSVALNGVLLKAGIPVQSRFGGVLEVWGNPKTGLPVRIDQTIVLMRNVM